MDKLVILDRDGVINEDSDDYVKSADEFILIEGSAEAIALLHRQGFTVVVATNQSGLARGYFSATDLRAMHAKLNLAVEAAGGAIRAIYYCPHGPDDHCRCRKPQPGLIDTAERELGLSARGAPLVGDSLRDLQAGLSKGCEPLLVRTGKGKKTAKQLQQTTEAGLQSVPVFDNLLQAARYITQHFGHGR